MAEEISHTEYIFRIANCTALGPQYKAHDAIETRSNNKLEETALPSTSQENTIILQFDVD